MLMMRHPNNIRKTDDDNGIGGSDHHRDDDNHQDEQTIQQELLQGEALSTTRKHHGLYYHRYSSYNNLGAILLLTLGASVAVWRSSIHIRKAQTAPLSTTMTKQVDLCFHAIRNSSKSNNRTLCGGCGAWEHDFFLDLFGASECIPVCQTNSVAMVGTTENMAHDIMDQQQRLAGNASLPRILIDKSGEHCNLPPRAWSVYDNFALVLRQYQCRAHYSYLYRRHPHVRPLALGYKSGHLKNHNNPSSAWAVLDQVEGALLNNGNHHNQTTTRRQYAWAFIGHVWHDERRDMVDTFRDVEPNFFNESVHVAQVHQLYRTAYFVLSGRGHANLDCLRHYEASLAGAIPVLMGSPQEFQETFGLYQQMPPWVFADSWAAAKLEVQHLLNHPAQLRQRQLACVQWMRNELLSTVEAILSVPRCPGTQSAQIHRRGLAVASVHVVAQSQSGVLLCETGRQSLYCSVPGLKTNCWRTVHTSPLK